MSKYIFVIFLLSIPVLVNAGETIGDSFILKGEEAQRVLMQCSRSAPTQISGLWEPNKNDIEVLEKSLQKYKLPKNMPHPLSSFYAQYVGIVINKKYIYINFFPKSIAKTIANAIEFAKKEKRKELLKKYESRMGYWEREAVNVCDGGDYYWGLIYDPELKVFTDFQVNGEA